MISIDLRGLVAAALCVCPVADASAQVPQYTAELLGQGTLVNDMNLHGQVVGWTVAGGVQAFLLGPGGQQLLLPLPDGYTSAWAQGINDAGVVVGSAATGGFPEFGQPCVWTPLPGGGYDAQLLPLPEGFTQGIAYDVNNRGDIIGNSIFPGFQGGPTTWFNAPGGALDLANLGAPSSPKEINDEGVIVGINGGLFDIDTLAVSPLPTFSAGMTNFQGWAVNDLGELAGTAFYGGVARAPATWTEANGWVQHSPAFSLSSQVQAYDINVAGVVVLEAPTPSVAYPGLGTHTLASRIAPPQAGQWSFSLSLGSAINDAGQIAAIGNGPSGTGVILLTPVGDGGFTDLGSALAGTSGPPQLAGNGVLLAGQPVTFALSGAKPSSSTTLVLGLAELGAPFKGGTLVPSPDVIVGGLPLDSAGGLDIVVTWPALPSGAQIVLQHWIVDRLGPFGFAASNGLGVTQP